MLLYSSILDEHCNNQDEEEQKPDCYLGSQLDIYLGFTRKKRHYLRYFHTSASCVASYKACRGESIYNVEKTKKLFLLQRC